MYERDGASIFYEVRGSGFPILLIAPGGMRSEAAKWAGTPWNPAEDLRGYTVVAMDQRNAGSSTAPVSGDDGWHTYTADQLGLMDHIGADRFIVMGMCIGGPYAAGLIEAAPDRVAAAVMFQTIGYDNNRDAFYEMFDSWADELKPKHREAGEDDWTRFRSNMYDGDFLFNPATPREFVASIETPLLVLEGNDLYHPSVASREVAQLAPEATLIKNWKDPADQPAAREAVRVFVEENAR